MQTGKVLTTGKDIKATQFTLGLSEKQGVKVALGFTKSNELFVGRMAMLGIAASIIGGTLNMIFTRCLWLQSTQCVLVGIEENKYLNHYLDIVQSC